MVLDLQNRHSYRISAHIVYYVSTAAPPAKLPVDHATCYLRATHKKKAPEARTLNGEDKQLAPVLLSGKGAIYSVSRHELP